jgi:vanillate O-demethylase ferredoxin subunit
MPADDLTPTRVRSVRDAAPGVREVVLDLPPGARAGFAPGAHREIGLPGGGTRPYSLMPCPDGLRFGVLLEAASTGGSAYMHGLAPGDEVRVGPEANDFPLHEGGAPALLIAGGIGITPFPAMAAALGDRASLLYCGRSRARMAFLDELPGARFHADDEAGGLPDLAAAIAALPEGAHVYVCGPRPMIEAGRAAAAAAGVPGHRVHVELFGATPAGGEAFEVELAETGGVHLVPAGRSIIEVLEEAGLDVMYDCKRGDCGICRTDVLDGVPDHRDVVLSDEEKAAGDVMQICVSRAKTPRLVLDL